MLAIAGGILIALAVLALLPVVAFGSWFIWKGCRWKTLLTINGGKAKSRRILGQRPLRARA